MLVAVDPQHHLGKLAMDTLDGNIGTSSVYDAQPLFHVLQTYAVVVAGGSVLIGGDLLHPGRRDALAVVFHRDFKQPPVYFCVDGDAAILVLFGKAVENRVAHKRLMRGTRMSFMRSEISFSNATPLSVR